MGLGVYFYVPAMTIARVFSVTPVCLSVYQADDICSLISEQNCYKSVQFQLKGVNKVYEIMSTHSNSWYTIQAFS